MNTHFLLRAGDVIRYAGQDCRVLRVSECAAVIALARPPRQFTTLFGQTVSIQPKPALVRISPNSEVQILNRKHHVKDSLNSELRCFRIVRFYHPQIGRRPRTIKTGLTEAEAQAHCSREDTRRDGFYFDGYDYMKGAKP